MSDYGVLVHGVRHDLHEYRYHSLHVGTFKTFGFLNTNVESLEVLRWRSLGTDAGMSRLGIPNVSTRTVSIALQLAKEWDSLHTLARRGNNVVSLNHRDADDDEHRLAIFRQVEDRFSFFSFTHLFRHALIGVWDKRPINITNLIENLVAEVNDGVTIESWQLASNAIRAAVTVVDNAFSRDIVVSVSPAGPLVLAWHCHVLAMRRPRLSMVDRLLLQAVQHVEQLSIDDLASRGVSMASSCMFKVRPSF